MFEWTRKKTVNRVTGACLLGDNTIWVMDEQGGFGFNSTDPTAWHDAAKRIGPSRMQLALTASHYQMIAIDRPPVPEEELVQALPFTVRDLATLPLARMQLDYFQLAVNPADRDMLQVVVSDRDVLTKMVTHADNNDLQLDMVTIEELVLLELLAANPRPQILLWHQPEQPLKLLITSDGKLLFSRSFRGFNQLDSMSEQELEMGLFDALQLELQRSMDYLERQLRQPPADSISLIVPPQHQAFLATRLEQAFGLPVQNLADSGQTPAQLMAHAAAMVRGHDEDKN
ncbi:hypothetical protein [Ferrimonas lipolytica]|uniref:MSHA biogenesis protein MshI n=1 Tax=Ferrimonas lipolytica TaxID=2724191 RepID=A0A6H1UI85_9GAMM|nr:hypothetical protein [Ferrimonas lipolytica]QIZ77926.1 hypothetical protein HER31_14100 [Ferrimonas lipolytica]